MQAHIVIDGKVHTTRNLDEVRRAQKDARVLWIDLETRSPEGDELLALFGIHPVVAEDIWVDRLVPKIEELEGYLHILVHGVSPGERRTSVKLWGLNVVLGPTWVITSLGNAKLAPDLSQCGTDLLQGPAKLAHGLLDQVIDGHVRVVEDLGRQIEAIEDEVLNTEDQTKTQTTVGVIIDLRRSIQKLTRVARRQLESLGHLVRGKHQLIPHEIIPYYRDLYDHFVRVSDLIDGYHEEITNALDGLVAVRSARMNAIMKRLTLLSTITLPMSLIAAIFGMNFHLPGEKSPYAFAVSLLIMFAVGGGFVAWFRYRRWV